MTKKRVILLVAAVLFVAMAACAKKSKGRESEWHGLSEDEVRSKLDAKLPSKIPAEKRAAISDKVVTKMREKGAIDDTVRAPDDASDLAEDASDVADDAEELVEN